MRVRTRCVSLRNQKVIFSAKGHDPDFRFLARHPADAVAVQAGTIDHVFGRESTPRVVSTIISAPRRNTRRTSVPVLTVPLVR